MVSCVSPGWFFWALVVAALSIWALGSLLWRERLTLDLERHRYLHETGFWPRRATVEGALGDIKVIALDAILHHGNEGGEYRTWRVSLVFADPSKTIGLGDFRREQDAYARVADLAARTRLTALDRTGGTERAVAPAEIDRPLVGRRGATSRIPPLPSNSGLVLIGEAPERRIVLPMAGLSSQSIVIPLMPLFPGWWTGTLTNYRLSWPFLAAALLFALIAVVAALSRRAIEETGDELSFAVRFFGLPLFRQRLAKSEIVEIAVKPVPSRPRAYDELQLRTAAAIVNLRPRRVAAKDLHWLADALRAMVAAA